ncbi:hypothetical protein G6L37_35055 [Agrobacterium rubi]|nr:hypothetical protein [Agrobacterium rubi]NTF23789.1 hypothetical protein [Agrobacterium rubi]
MAIITPQIEDRLRALYEAPGRHHHGWGHILHMRGLAMLHAKLITHLDALLVMIVFHDAIYDSRRKDNEKRSSDLARAMLTGLVPEDTTDMICAGIEATEKHLVPEGLPETWRRDIAFLLDFDLAIIGADEKEFDLFDHNVRLEYDWVDDEAWRVGRAEVMRSFARRSSIYFTKEFREEFEVQARNNITRLSHRLESQGEIRDQ